MGWVCADAHGAWRADPPVQLDAGKVAKYRVWAPTDAFFADAVALSGLLAGRQFAAPDEARRALDQAILALDPCVPYVLELNDA